MGTSHFSAPKRLGEERQNGGGTLGKGSQVSSGRQLGHREAEVRPRTGIDYLVKEKPAPTPGSTLRWAHMCATAAAGLVGAPGGKFQYGKGQGFEEVGEIGSGE